MTDVTIGEHRTQRSKRTKSNYWRTQYTGPRVTSGEHRNRRSRRTYGWRTQGRKPGEPMYGEHRGENWENLWTGYTGEETRRTYGRKDTGAGGPGGHMEKRHRELRETGVTRTKDTQ